MLASTATLLTVGPLIGNPRFQPGNSVAAGNLLPNQRGSYLGQLLSPEGEPRFGFGDHIGAPITRVEAQFTTSLADTVAGLFSRALRLQRTAATLLDGTSGSPGQNTHGAVVGGSTGYLGATQPTG